MKILVHLGIHKTATTFIQSQLANNRTELAGRGYGVAGIWVVRKKFTNLFDRLSYFDPVWRFLTRPMLKRRLDRMTAASGKVGTFLLSDENLLGLISANYWRGALYPWAARRVKILRSLIEPNEAHFFLCIRRYPEYLTSSWLQMAAKGKPPAFEKYLEKFPPESRGWSEIVADICGAVGAENVTVWTYDWFSEDKTRVFQLLAPGTDFTVPEKELSREILPSLTIKGLNVINQLEDHLSRGELKRLSALIRTFPFDEPNPRLEIGDPALLAAYEEKYLADIEAIRAMGVTFHG